MKVSSASKRVMLRDSTHNYIGKIMFDRKSSVSLNKHVAI